jgi:heterodisulfide reductase subunit B2
LARAKVAGMERVLAPCAMCYQRLASASKELKGKPELSAKVSKSLGYGAGMESIEALSILNWLSGMKDEAISKPVNKPLKGLKVACYYGCLLVRPPKITGATPSEVENPQSMQRVVNLLGAQAVKWSMATECCGGSFSLSRKETVIRQGRRIYTAAKNAGADVIVLACPMCHSNLDMRQGEYKTGDDLPVVYLTQLMGLAYGVPASELGCKSHFVAVAPMMAKV